MDDSYVYFRYVDNLVARGIGLVWNPGEYVEGFSSPLWALLLVALRRLHLDFWVVVRAVGLISFAVFWLLAVVANRGLTLREARSSVSYNIPLVYLSFCYGALCYFTSGLEAPLVMVSAGLYACAVLWPERRWLQILLGVTPLVRPELTVPFLLWGLVVWLRSKRVPWTALASAAVSVGGYLIFRIWYYADIFPNTFHLKDELWIGQGLRYVWDTVGPYWTLPLLAALFVLYMVLRRRTGGTVKGAERLTMFLLALSVAVYVVKVGGAPIHFKDLAFPFTLAVLAGGGLLEGVGARWSRAWRAVTVVGMLVFAFAVVNMHPRQFQRSPLRQVNAFGHGIVDLISDAAYHRAPARGLIPGRGAGAEALSYAAAERRYGGASDSGPVQTDSWCRTSYMRPESRIIHSLGLTEPFLSRTPVHSDRPAHKFGLEQLAADIAAVRRAQGFRAGAFDDAIAEGKGKAWMKRNIDAIHLIERRVYNKHSFLENLALAFRRPEVIVVEDGEVGRTEKQ
jgi:hypothetical protein